MNANATQRVDGGMLMLSLLTEQVQMYEALEKLIEKQSALIAGGDLSPLLKLLATRQKLTERLQQLGAQTAAEQEKWNQARDSIPTEQREQVERLAHNVQTRVKRLLDQDARDASMLSARKQRVGQDLRGLDGGQQVARAYRSADATTSTRFDQTDEQA